VQHARTEVRHEVCVGVFTHADPAVGLCICHIVPSSWLHTRSVPRRIIAEIPWIELSINTSSFCHERL